MVAVEKGKIPITVATLIVVCGWTVAPQPDPAHRATGTASIAPAFVTPNGSAPAHGRAETQHSGQSTGHDDCTAGHTVAVSSSDFGTAMRTELLTSAISAMTPARQDVLLGRVPFTAIDFRVVRVPHLLCVMRT